MPLLKQLKWVLALIGATLVIIIALQNNDPVVIRVLFWDAQVDRLLLFPALFLAGLLVGFILGWGWERKKARPASS